MTRSFSATLFLAFAFLTLAVLTACARATDTVRERAEAETYIRSHISQLSPESSVLGGTFYVTDIQWNEDDSATVRYEDGHIAFVGETRIEEKDPVTVETLTNVREDVPPPKSSESSSANVRPRAKLGEFCGGIAGFQCDEGLTCKLEGTYPDAGGKCVAK